jgi:hypothetical protein
MKKHKNKHQHIKHAQTNKTYQHKNNSAIYRQNYFKKILYIDQDTDRQSEGDFKSMYCNRYVSFKI